MQRYDQVLVPEMNLGQLSFLLQGKYLQKVVSYPKVQGQPFKVSEIFHKIAEVLGHTPEEMN